MKIVIKINKCQYKIQVTEQLFIIRNSRPNSNLKLMLKKSSIITLYRNIKVNFNLRGNVFLIKINIFII